MDGCRGTLAIHAAADIRQQAATLSAPIGAEKVKMTTKEDVISAIEAADARVKALAISGTQQAEQLASHSPVSTWA